ncbi:MULTISPECIES: cystathionine gamma-synthase family protein [Cytobacillus]|uniref:cystathionine gamma-synthase family protein n=1 Tax=Cytobacillus TaxID=2675230 RepID=UPI0018642EA3|nr:MULTISPECIES: cystathionine gamma-synthase family protein [Cytobacillus]MBY0154310.1 cystathionine gamma-synthase family protein [Cytobacillus firmus]MBU8732423.1 cystathionine gamma-synthase family protein [Cytobacillus oceanisediminis]MCM3246681.1 cystathionine gamma-synthase family protein [Cytobacillus oceanisediminis]MCM3392713.1 cystathionine gamma-synthase family protein [Cytobacillus oceanisediminis]MCM3403199.1 cystathionine gamma-synthase family protein [Cytobacillus oceanisedimin
MVKENVQAGTKAVWAGEKDYLVHGATQVPVVLSVAYGYDDMDEWYDVAIGKKKGHIYGRNTNPTVQAFEDKVKILEGAEAATSFSTGMAAISNTLSTFLVPGDRIVSMKDTYGGTNKIFTEFLPRQQIDVVLCETGNHEQIEAEVAKGCKILYLETPTNPTVKITDIERMAKAGHDAGAIVIVDNTFATPMNQNPISLGVDLVIHSATKFLGGHADALGGVVCGPHELVEKIYHYREINGATMDPMAAYLMIRGMKTLHLRVRQQCKNAMELAKYLQTKDMVESVYYPGIETHPNHHIAKKQMKDFGGMLSFAVKGGVDTVRDLLPKLQFANRAANLGAVETTVGPARTTSHVECTPEERAAVGIPEGLIRVSCGIEEIEDIIADFEQAFSHAESVLQVK